MAPVGAANAELDCASIGNAPNIAASANPVKIRFIISPNNPEFLPTVGHGCIPRQPEELAGASLPALCRASFPPQSVTRLHSLLVSVRPVAPLVRAAVQAPIIIPRRSHRFADH